VRVIVLASGSSGNATVVEANGACVLLDCGLSVRQLAARMAPHGLHPHDVQAVFLTHEHIDHVRGLEVLQKKHQIPVFATTGTARALAGRVAVQPALRSGHEVFHEGLGVLPVATSHDAAEPVGFVLRHGGFQLGMVTDTGVMTELLLERLGGCHALLLEANHDLDMLRIGSYPWPLKQRIRSSTGHLSNCQARAALERLVGPELRMVVAMHLSQENNTPGLARQELDRVLAGSLARCTVSTQEEPLVVDLGALSPDADGGVRLDYQLSTLNRSAGGPAHGPHS